MVEVVEIGKKPVNGIDDMHDDMHDDVCENCAYSRFKDTGPLGECRVNPPTVGMIMVPQQNPITRQVEPMMQPWTSFPTVERRTFCHTFDPIEVETLH